MTTLTYSGSLTIVTCWCGMRHAVPSELENCQRRQHDDGIANVQAIYCPLGHTHVPAGKSEIERERERLRRLEAQKQHLSDQLQATERSRAALKGQVTKIKKRVGKGVCPCCNRSFTNVERHMATQHPDMANA